MMPLALIAFVIAQGSARTPFAFTQLQAQGAALGTREPRRVLLPEDALFRIPGLTGRVVPVGDFDGGGVDDFVVAQGRGGRIEALVVVSTETRAVIRRLWSPDRLSPGRVVWDAGGDVNADGVADLILGFPTHGDSASFTGAVLVVSGADASTIRRMDDGARGDRLGTAVVFLGDVDGDGCDDYAVGAPQIDPREPLFERWIVDSASGRGIVSVRSGRDGSELWRATGRRGSGYGTHLAGVGDLDADGRTDLVVQCDLRSRESVVLLSSLAGDMIGRVPHHHRWARPAGDVDGDGVPDLFFEGNAGGDPGRGSTVRLVSGKSRESLGDLSCLPAFDVWSEVGRTVMLGDLDGDGHDDLAFGEAKYHLQGRDWGVEPPDLRAMTLAQALELRSMQSGGGLGSGIVVVVSGRTRKVMFGVWGRPGIRDGMGLDVAPLPDVNGDGHPDLVVIAADGGYVFAGPGPVVGPENRDDGE